MIYTYENTADSFLHMTMTNSQHHYFGKMPMVEYRNNEEKQGDFEQMIPLDYLIHIAVRYNTWSKLKQYVTWKQAGQRTWKKIKEEVF